MLQQHVESSVRQRACVCVCVYLGQMKKNRQTKLTAEVQNQQAKAPNPGNEEQNTRKHSDNKRWTTAH